MNEWMNGSFFSRNHKDQRQKKKIGLKKFGERKAYGFFREFFYFGWGGREDGWMNESFFSIDRKDGPWKKGVNS